MKIFGNTIRRKLRKYILISLPLWGGPGWGVLLSSCVDNPIPSDHMLPEQIEKMEKSQAALLSGIVAYVNDLSTWSSSDTYYTQDWGYPCQMFYREILGADIPTQGSYNYWINVEKNMSLTGASYYTYYYYYSFIRQCNGLIGQINPETATQTSLQYRGCAQTFRALCYMDLARMFEFQPTGYTSLDDEALQLGLGTTDSNGRYRSLLTVPIVTDKTPDNQLTNNPRAPFTTMYRFILADLNEAEQLLYDYTRPNGTYPDRSVVYGLQARLWLEMATRFERSDEDLADQLALEGCGDGYADLNIQTARDCYERAADYARRAKEGYTPMTESEWTNPQTGFNTATDAWMLFSRVSAQEQEGNYFSSLLGTVCTEATWGMPQYGGGNYRCIGDWLYNSIPESDWRKKSWIGPDDAGHAPNDKYRPADADNFAKYPAYANLKFRTRDTGDIIEGLKCDLPLMRVEEMYLIEAEAEAHLNGVNAGAALLNQFVNTYRSTDGKYDCMVENNTLAYFTQCLMQQRRIEFWGEGITYFDYKRLRLPVRRSLSTNYPKDMRTYNNGAEPMDSKDGYVCPSMNYFILTFEVNNNPAVIPNPDCSKWYEK